MTGVRSNGSTGGMGSRRAKLRLRLKHIILTAVLWSIVVAELAILLPATFLWHREELQRVETETLRLLKANVDVTTFPTVAETVRIIHRLTTFSEVRGGLVVNALGDELGAFGERPALTLGASRRNGQNAARSPDARFLDVVYPMEATGLAHPVILRLDTREIVPNVITRLVEKAFVVLAVALVAGIVVAILLGIWIVRPVVRLRDAAIAATDNPDNADGYRLKWTRTDELGDAARAFDLLLTAVSIVHQEDLAASQEAIQRSSFAMLTYDASGRLTIANPAALKLFGWDTMEEISRQAASFVRMTTATGEVDMPPIEMMRVNDVSQLVQVVTRRGVKRCMMNGTVIRKKNGSVLRYAVVLVDMSKQASYVEHLEKEFQRLQAEDAAAKRRIAEMKGLFESCLAILSNAPSAPVAQPTPPADDAPIVLTDRIVNALYGEAQKSGLVTGRMQHAVLPPVKGDPAAIESVFR